MEWRCGVTKALLANILSSRKRLRGSLKMQLADKYGVFYGGITNLRAFAKPVNPTV